MEYIKDNNTILNGSIVFLIKNLIGKELEYDSICALLDANGHLMKESDILYYNSTHKDSFGIYSNEDETVHGPMCPNDGEEIQFWKDKFFEMEYFIIHLDEIDLKIQSIEFLLLDYEKYYGASKEGSSRSWKDCGIEIFYTNKDHDPLGKNVVVYDEPLIRNNPEITSFINISNEPHAIVGRLNRESDGWLYTPIWKGLTGIDEHLQRY